MCFPSEMFFTEMGIVSTALWGPLASLPQNTNLPDAGGRGLLGEWGRLFTVVVTGTEPNWGCYCF